jgi:hypothetical protein
VHTLNLMRSLTDRNKDLADRILEQLVRMARLPGSKDYAWSAAKYYASLNPADFGDLPERLKHQILKERVSHG